MIELGKISNISHGINNLNIKIFRFNGNPHQYEVIMGVSNPSYSVQKNGSGFVNGSSDNPIDNKERYAWELLDEDPTYRKTSHVWEPILDFCVAIPDGYKGENFFSDYPNINELISKKEIVTKEIDDISHKDEWEEFYSKGNSHYHGIKSKVVEPEWGKKLLRVERLNAAGSNFQNGIQFTIEKDSLEEVLTELKAIANISRSVYQKPYPPIKLSA